MSEQSPLHRLLFHLAPRYVCISSTPLVYPMKVTKFLVHKIWLRLERKSSPVESQADAPKQGK